MINRKKEPETPGSTSAHTAIEAAMSTSHRGGCVGAACGSDVSVNRATLKNRKTAMALPRMPG